jgi:hypothetical protein
MYIAFLFIFGFSVQEEVRMGAGIGCQRRAATRSVGTQGRAETRSVGSQTEPLNEPAPRATATPAQGSACGGVSGHVYSVWVVPGYPALTGVHTGGLVAWRALETCFVGQRYHYSKGIRLRRAESLAAGICMYQLEAAHHTVALQPVVHHW